MFVPESGDSTFDTVSVSGYSNHIFKIRDQNGTDIFRTYSRPDLFRGVQICPYSSSDIQHPISYPYLNTQNHIFIMSMSNYILFDMADTIHIRIRPEI